MTYNKTTWQNGDTITSEKLNNIESGVESASKQVTITRIINNSTGTVVPVGSNCVLIDGVLYNAELGHPVVSPNSTLDIVTLPYTDAFTPSMIDVWLLRLDQYAVVTSDTFYVHYDGDWECTITELPIPDNLSITISDPPLGEERTISIQSGSFISGLPESVTGRVNEWVYIEQVSVGGDSASAYAYYDQSTQHGDELFMNYDGPIDNLGGRLLTLSFRIPSTDVVSDTGYIQINGSR